MGRISKATAEYNLEKKAVDLWEEAFDAIPELVAIQDQNFRILKVNKAFSDTIGLPSDQIIGKKCCEVVHGSNQLCFLCSQQGTRQDEEFEIEEYYKPHLDLNLQITCSPIVNARNEIMGSVYIARDISRQKKIEFGLRKKEEILSRAVQERALALSNIHEQMRAEIKVRERAENDYQLLFRAMLSGFALHEIICDGQGNPINYRFLIVNPAFEKLTGLKEEQVVGRTVREVLPNIERYWIDIYGKVALTGEPVFFENYSADLKKYFEVTAFRPAIDQFACVFDDITERKQNESHLALLRHELAHLARVLTMNELATSLAHEINQPLGAILNNASAAKLLMSHVKDGNQDIDEILTDIIKDARRAGDVIRKIKGIVKKGDVKFELLDMNALIKDVMEMYRNSVIINKISLSLDLKPDLAKIKGDRVHLQQVLLNLITNALDAMQERPTRILMIRSSADSDMVTVSVSDSGTGLDDAMKEKLFEPFISTKKDGLGMGLSICQSIVEEHGGRFWAENNPDMGATFSFSLKVYRKESA